MDEEEYHLDEEELQELQFNIFNSDINLLSVHILLEASRINKYASRLAVDQPSSKPAFYAVFLFHIKA